MRKLLTAAAVFSLLLGLCLPLPAQAAENSKSWRITASAHVLSNRAGEMVIYLAAPQNLKIEREDFVSPYHTLPLGDDTAFVDKQGAAIAQADILPGQAVKVSVRYTYEESGIFRYKREARVTRCYEVQLDEGIIAPKSTAKPGTLAPDTAIGTVVQVTADRVLLYVEDGYTQAESGARYYGIGVHGGRVSDKTKITDAGGQAVSLLELKPFQRVQITGSPEFFDGSLGFEWDTFESIRVMGAGEKVFAAATPAYDNIVRCTVVENRGGTELLVRPDQQSWAGGQRDLYTVPYQPGTLPEPAPTFGFRSGDVVDVRFEGIRTDSSPGVLITDAGGVTSVSS